MIKPIFWKDDHVHLIDQTLLPSQEMWHRYHDYEDVARAIEHMLIRGAPAIGIAAGYGLSLAALNLKDHSPEMRQSKFEEICTRFSKTRPTAVNLFWAIDRIKNVARRHADQNDWHTAILNDALAIHREDIDACQRIGAYGASLISKDTRVLTHCNAGALATGAWGTALGIVRSAHELGKIKHVWIDETRPFLQGARLTAWELVNDKIPAYLISDNMAAYFMQQGEVDCVITGADRIAANGDTANKIGTYGLAVLADAHHIPLYVAAPHSTFDLSLSSGNQIPIEERDTRELRVFGQSVTAPPEVMARHPAFDVTPAKFITALITEKGIIEGPNKEKIAQLLS